MPMTEEDLYSKHKKIKDSIQYNLDQKTKTLVDTEKIIELKKELNDMFEKDFQAI